MTQEDRHQQQYRWSHPGVLQFRVTRVNILVMVKSALHFTMKYMYMCIYIKLESFYIRYLWMICRDWHMNVYLNGDDSYLIPTEIWYFWCFFFQWPPSWHHHGEFSPFLLYFSSPDFGAIVLCGIVSVVNERLLWSKDELVSKSCFQNKTSPHKCIAFVQKSESICCNLCIDVKL